MSEQRNLPITGQTFEKLRNKGSVYVDKTQYIEKLLLLGECFFLSRPHRFGKSLFLSTLQAYFEGKKELFEGLYIAEREEEIARRQRREPWEARPVLYFDLNAEHFSHGFEVLENCLETSLVAMENRYGSEGVAKTLSGRFKAVIERAYEQTGKQVVILIDEYDKPLLSTLEDPELNEANRLLLQAFYEVLKNCDRYIYFAFLTGITKFSKMNLFSGANNLKDLSLLDKYDAICGFTEQELADYFMPEIERLAQAENTSVEATRQRLKKEYDGYCFARKGEKVYNPFSLLNVLSDSIYSYYWFETATPSYLVNYLRNMPIFMPDLEGDIRVDSSSIEDFRYDDDDVVPLLFQSGYLTIKKYDPRSRLFHLGYPNEEVRFGFLRELLPLYSSFRRSNIADTISNLYLAFNSGNLADAMKEIEVILGGILYGNIPNGEAGRPLREQYYQTVLHTVFRLLGIYARAEVTCASGRIDMVVTTRKHVYIFEFKVNTQGSAQDAINQIKELGYLRSVRAGKRPVHLVGVSFDEKTRNIGEWEEEIIHR